jgi:hypothetical protein
VRPELTAKEQRGGRYNFCPPIVPEVPENFDAITGEKGRAGRMPDGRVGARIPGHTVVNDWAL